MKQFILLTTCLTSLCLPSLAKVEIKSSSNSVGKCEADNTESKWQLGLSKSRYEYKAEKAASKASIETACFKTCEQLAKNTSKDSATEASDALKLAGNTSRSAQIAVCTGN